MKTSTFLLCIRSNADHRSSSDLEKSWDIDLSELNKRNVKSSFISIAIRNAKSLVAI